MATLPTKEEIKKAYQQAPEYIQTYIISKELADVFNTIRTAYKLHFDEAGQISIALNAVFLEVRPTAEFPDLLKVALEQNGDKYDVVLKDINEKIFTVFREKVLTRKTETPEMQSAQKEVPKTPTVVPTPPEKENDIPLVSVPETQPKPDPINQLEKTVSNATETVSVNTLEDETTPKPKLREEVEQADKKYTQGADPYREVLD